MTVIRIIKWSLAVVVAIAVAILAVVIALQEPIPPAGTAAADNNRIYDASYANIVASVHEDLDAYRASLVSPSISVAVGVRGELVWADASGYSDIDSRTLATPDTIYAIGSQFAVAASAVASDRCETGLRRAVANRWMRGLTPAVADFFDFSVEGFEATFFDGGSRSREKVQVIREVMERRQPRP